ncbi:hypothetical protein [Massilia sp. DWR3-1-1]|uniref:hypothetical protein n=1 Tax=Massilia sp. DWR3-1-1 TaxID=2804559 RepID=UPI003CF00F53
MKTLLSCLILASAALTAACSREAHYDQRQTGMPGVVSSGGGTSGEVIASHKKPSSDASYAGGTPFHAGGAGGNTGGTATAGAVAESGHGPSGTTAPPAAKTTPSGQ